MEIEITQEEYEKYLQNKNIDKTVKAKFKEGDLVQLKNKKTDDIYIIDFYYWNRESYNKKENNKLYYKSIIYYIIHNKDTNIKYTVKEEDIILFKNPTRYSSYKDYKTAIIDKYMK
jgi:hypothetical protein